MPAAQVNPVEGEKLKNMDEKRIKRIITEVEQAVHDDIYIIKEQERFDFVFYLIRYRVSLRSAPSAFLRLRVASQELIGRV